MNDLVEFLLARIAEDEYRGVMDVHHASCDRFWVSHAAPCTCIMPSLIAADCAAKRQIVERAAQAQRDYDHDTNEWTLAAMDLRDLALPYSDHPDYRPEWRP